ncbi:MAG TPA: RNB domain-containing ribonuclease [Burkholderiales bacterium]|nr:RNB domain-containing ribonuclease [Burkholderiales bacterium]
MNVFYEEEGTLKVGAVLADNNTSLQVEAPHGKRSKIKSSAVLFRFEQPPVGEFLGHAQRAADELDLDFLWQCSSSEEFEYSALAREYYGHEPGAVEAASVLLKLHGAPMYFYKRGSGRYKAAPGEALKAALASVERKKQQALQKDAYVTQLAAGDLPPQFERMLPALLYKPHRNSIEWKALEDASTALKITPVRVIERCGGIPSTHDYHLNRFVFEHFPRGVEFGEAAIAVADDLPLSDAVAFSIDDATTTEIDDAFSVTALPSGNTRIGIHIAAPALGIVPNSAVDDVARERLSTVYFPGGKITMLPPAAIETYTLAAGRDCPALSLYVELLPRGEVVSLATRVERVRIAENLRHDTLEPLFNAQSLEQGPIEHPYGRELKALWQWAVRLEEARRGDAPEGAQRAEYSFRVADDRVQITRRPRGTPVDKLVSELMIYVNSTWGRELAESATPAIYRAQAGGKVRMTTVPAAHVGLGVEQYVWASSPLRRYLDLVNQRQLIALARGASPPHPAGDEQLPAIMREFESAYEAYADFQRTMERYWCLRWLLQEKASVVEATVLRDNLCRFDELPLVARVPSLPARASGKRVALVVSEIDLLELAFHCEFRREIALGLADVDVLVESEALGPTVATGR